MFIKLGIIVGIVILGGMIFSNEIDSLFPNTSATIVDSLKNDISNFNTKSLDSVETRIDESIDKIVDKTSDAISDAITDEISNIGNDISNKISNVRQSAQQTITEKIINFNPLHSIQNIFTNII
jgi:gas vesicle protein